MSSVQEIEAAIVSLSPREQQVLHKWMDERIARAIDGSLEEALTDGAFDAQIQQALADYEAGNTRLL